MLQVLELAASKPFTGRLNYFRATLQPNGKSAACHTLYPVPVYANLCDIEELEAQLSRGNFSDFIVQCCSICEAYLAVRPGNQPCFRPDFQPYKRIGNDEMWIFANARDIEEIATLRHRLNSLCRSSKIQEIIEDATIDAALRSIRERPPQWQELLMLLRASGARTVLLVTACARLENWFTPLAETMPRAACSLLLSYICNRLARGSPCYSSPFSKFVILRLVSSGASLMTSTADHPVLSKMIMEHLALEETPWWLDKDTPADSGESTTLCRLGLMGWTPAQMKKLLLQSCCTLDLRSRLAARQVSRVPKLECLAAQKLRMDQVPELPCSIQASALKHIPVEAFDRWNASPFYDDDDDE